MQNTDLVVSLVTFYKDSNDIRRNLALRTLQELVKQNFSIVIVDGGSEKTFLDEIDRLRIQRYEQQKKGLREAKREAFQRAHETGKPLITCMEPEKFDYISYLPKLVRYLKEHSLDILVPGRESFDSYSTFQGITENAQNYYIANQLGLNWDYCSGFLIWKREVSSYLLEFKERTETAYWDITIIPPLIAKKEGKTVEQIKINFQYPKEMRDEEEGSIIFNDKRIAQLIIMTNAFKQYPELKFN